jgi:hypothetical protein
LFRPAKDGVVANEDVRSISASEATDALEDCKRRMEWFKNFDAKSHLKKRIAALETRLRGSHEVKVKDNPLGP